MSQTMILLHKSLMRKTLAVRHGRPGDSGSLPHSLTDFDRPCAARAPTRGFLAPKSPIFSPRFPLHFSSIPSEPLGIWQKDGLGRKMGLLIFLPSSYFCLQHLHSPILAEGAKSAQLPGRGF
jgi:hypothetical protein